MITDEKMEKLIAELYEESIRETDVSVDMEALLDNAYKELEEKEKKKAAEARKKKAKAFVRAAVVFIGILVVSLVVFEPEQGYADVFRFMFDRDARGNEVISDNLIGEETVEDVVELTVTLEELDEAAGFHVPMPEYVPEGYELETGIKIVEGYGKVLTIYVSYVGTEKNQIIIYNVVPIDQKKTQSTVMDIAEEDIRETEINDTVYYIYSDKENKKNAIYWEEDEYMYSIDGNISEEEVVKIVESIK